MSDNATSRGDIEQPVYEWWFPKLQLIYAHERAARLAWAMKEQSIETDTDREGDDA